MPPGGQDAAAGMDSAVAYGLMNALHTGQPLYDTLTCTIIPSVMSAATNLINNVRPTVYKAGVAALRLGKTEYVRTITYEKTMSNWGDAREGANANNKILQKAIMLFISENKLLTESVDADFKLMPLGAEESTG